MREVFEIWFLDQFGGHGDDLLGFSEKDGYEDAQVYSMWVAFIGGFEVAKFVQKHLIKGDK